VFRTKLRELGLKRPPKYRNKKVVADGIRFDSEKEWHRYTELQLALKSGLITKLQVHPKFELVVKGIKVCSYIADFCYLAFPCGRLGKAILTVEDVKSRPTMTPVYRLKKKLLRALRGIEVKEI